jgi:diguanylate cyclase
MPLFSIKGDVMPFSRYMPKGEIAATISVLDQALYRHEQWVKSVYSSLICRLPPDERDLSNSPHRRCAFGQWYYAQENTDLSQHPGFIAVSSEHEQLHRMAAHMLITSSANEPITVSDYENFVNASTRMRAEILGLKNELEGGLTNLDPLTGATSRIGMLTQLRAQLEIVKRDLHSCTIAMMDLDLFKGINDEYGHQAGDTVLIETVQQVMTHLRPYDEFFRYGGDEFLLCAPEIDLESGHRAVERLREGLEATPVDVGHERVLRVTASFGVTLLDPDVPVEVSIARADQALYRAKAAGRNQTGIWDASMA